MKSVWVSIRRLKMHEFRTTLRHIKRTGLTWHDIYTKLGQLQNEAVSRTMKQASGLIVSYLLLVSLSDPSTVSITFQGVTASIPTAFVAVLASVSLFIVFQGLQSFYMLLQIRSSEGTRLRLHGFSMNAYGLFNDQDEMALVTPVLLNGFMRERIPVTKVLITLSMCIFLSLLLPLFAMWVYLFQIQLEIVFSSEVILFYQVCAGFGLFVLGAIALTIVLFNFPFPMRKQPYAIRWGFLSMLYPVGAHPRVQEWLDDRPVQEMGPE